MYFPQTVKLNDNSLDPVLGLIQEAHKILGSLSIQVSFDPMICFFNISRMAQLMTIARSLVRG